MFTDKENILVINDPQALLDTIHETFFADTIDQPRNAGRKTIDFIQSPAAEQFLTGYTCVCQM